MRRGLLLLLLAFAGCEASLTPRGQIVAKGPAADDTDVWRFHDDAKHVVCWLGHDSIDCIPCWALAIEEGHGR